MSRALAVLPDRDDGFDDSSVALRAEFDSHVLPPKAKQQTGDREFSVQFDGRCLERRAISGRKRVQRCEIVYNRAAESADLGRRVEFKWHSSCMRSVGRVG